MVLKIFILMIFLLFNFSVPGLVGEALAYERRIGQEHFSHNIVKAHFFKDVGTRYITLVAKNQKGRRNYVTKKVRVVEAPEGILRAKIFVHPGTRNKSGAILGKVHATDDSSIVGGKIIRRTWTLSNGDTQEGFSFLTRLDPGKYLLSLEVETDQGTTAITRAAFDVAAKYRNDEIASSVNTTIAGYNSSAFNPIALTLSVSFDGDGIDLNRAIDITFDYTSLVTATTKTSANEIVIGINALDGLNDLVLSAFDKSGYYIQKRVSFLAGSRTITVDVLDSMSNQVTAGSFKAVHTKTNTEVAITTVTSNQFVVNNAPASDLYLYFIKTDGDFAGKRISSTDTDVDLNLRGFSTISTTANPDLSHGSTGWTFNSKYITLVQVGGENRFQIDMEQGESTEFSHALIASQRYLSYPVQLEGNIVDAHTNIILRNYTQDTVSVRSLSPQDLGFNTPGEPFDIFKGYVSIEAATGDQLEIIVQITAPAASRE